MAQIGRHTKLCYFSTNSLQTRDLSAPSEFPPSVYNASLILPLAIPNANYYEAGH